MWNSQKIRLSLALAALLVTHAESLTFGIINGGSDFFNPIRDGFMATCEERGITCLYRVPEDTSTTEQFKIELLRELQELQVDGIAIYLEFLEFSE